MYRIVELGCGRNVSFCDSAKVLISDSVVVEMVGKTIILQSTMEHLSTLQWPVVKGIEKQRRIW